MSAPTPSQPRPRLAPAHALRAGDPALGPIDDLALARRTLEEFDAPDAEQARMRDFILRFVEEHPADAHRRTCLEGHLTASALLLDASGTRALLTHHKKLGRWLQLGGHCDGDANLAAAALRECQEESGIEKLRIDPVPFDVDVHRIPARKDEPEHWHLDTRFLVWAPAGVDFVVSDESHDLAWVGAQELAGLAVDDSVRRLYVRAGLVAS